MIILRDYQERLIESVRGAFRDGARAPLIALPTGGGKTVVFAQIAALAAVKATRTLIVAHRRELIRQASGKLADLDVRHGIMTPGFPKTDALVQVGSIQALDRRLDRIGEFDLIVVNEAHHAVAAQYRRVIASQPKTRVIGVTATPERLDGKGLGVSAGGVFDVLVEGPSIAELVAAGHLCPARIFAPAGAPDLSRVRTRLGDYAVDDLRQAVGAAQITGDAVEHYRRHADGQPAIAFCIDVAHAEEVAAAFRAAGWRAAAVSGTTPTKERDAAIAGLGTGATQILASADLISEGLDVPAVSAVILLRPTQSLGLYLQQIGRGLRPAPGKSHLVVLDHAGNVYRHGLPDAERAWSLDGRADRRVRPKTRRCPECGAVHDPAPCCPVCGRVYVVERRERGVEVADGRLAEVDADRLRQIRDQPLCRILTGSQSLTELQLIGSVRGYKAGWAWHTHRDQAARAAAGSP